mgnify:CR=1 FL=1
MRTRRPLRPLLGLLIFLALPVCGFAQAQGPYARLLGRCVRGARVDYPCVIAHAADLDAYLASLAATVTADLGREARFAYFINAYNAWTLKLVADHYPVASIKDIGPFWSTPWKIAFVRLDGRTVTLDHLENEILRPVFKDPRVHFAINCASASCPPLRAEPYAADRLDEQLDDAASRFINDPAFNSFKDGVLRLSRIFDWFQEDFGGEKGVLALVERYARGDLRKGLRSGAPLRITYLDYDWSLNAAPDNPDSPSGPRGPGDQGGENAGNAARE